MEKVVLFHYTQSSLLQSLKTSKHKNQELKLSVEPTICTRVCGVFLIDSHFMVDGGKFISGALAALSVMVNLEVPHVNVLSKVLED